MKFLYSPIVLLLLSSFTAYSQTHSYWINELHYLENTLSQGFEVCGPAYVDLANWRYIVYNDDESVRLPSQSLLPHTTIEQELPGSLGCIWIDVALNPSGGAIALLDGTTLLDFISYEIPLTVDINSVSYSAYQIPVTQNPASQRMSLQLTGVGVTATAFRWWQSILPSYGETNVNQAFMSNCEDLPRGGVWHELDPTPDPDINCAFYESREGYCAFSWATIPGVAGLTGQQACCICGGGVTWGPSKTPSFSPSTSPSRDPSTSPSIEPTKSIAAYEEELADCQNQTAVYQEILDGYTNTIAMCEARGISLTCTSPPSPAPFTEIPTATPSDSPETRGPSNAPSETPSSSYPSTKPSPSPQTVVPSNSPVGTPSAGPSVSDPTSTPSDTPSSSDPTTTPTEPPQTSLPSNSPINGPSSTPSNSDPSTSPIVSPTGSPVSSQPSSGPSITVYNPTAEPTVDPTFQPTSEPSENPIASPSGSPSCTCIDLKPPSAPGGIWSEDLDVNGGVGRFTCAFISLLTELCDDGVVRYGLTAAQACCACGGGSCAAPSLSPVFIPTQTPTINQPTLSPVFSLPSTSPSLSPTFSEPSTSPSQLPTTDAPSLSPVTSDPSLSPTVDSPSQSPSLQPSSDEPTQSPETTQPSLSPTFDEPTVGPTSSPEVSVPSTSPTSDIPSTSPIASDPTVSPTEAPSTGPSTSPETSIPSTSPETSIPSVQPSDLPTETKVDCYDYTPENGTAFYGGQWVDKWYDSQRLVFDCDWYRHARDNPQELCDHFSPLYIGLDGLNANQACCVCGGGITEKPSAAPSPEPSTPFPTGNPTLAEPTTSPSQSPESSDPSKSPSSIPSTTPTSQPTPSIPTITPSPAPSASPTASDPSVSPTSAPTTSMPTVDPTFEPTVDPTYAPTMTPTVNPTFAPSTDPSEFPSTMPSTGPTCKCEDLRPPTAPNGEWHELGAPGRLTCRFYEAIPDLCLTNGADPSYAMYGHTASSACCVCGGGFCGLPTISPTYAPSTIPSKVPTVTLPSVTPTISPFTAIPSTSPSSIPTTDLPTVGPTDHPATSSPTDVPSTTPSKGPSISLPSVSPTQVPTLSDPTVTPSEQPSVSNPTTSPSEVPTASDPTVTPSDAPVFSDPTVSPSSNPSTGPTLRVHCVDFVPEGETEWYDAYPTTQIKWTCENYEAYSDSRRNYCDIFNLPERDANFGMIANQACCFCGGGITAEPTKAPSATTAGPSKTPARVPTTSPVEAPSPVPVTQDPSTSPVTPDPTHEPTLKPSSEPTDAPTTDPSINPTFNPTDNPTGAPTTTLEPTSDPSFSPTSDPSMNPTFDPSNGPTSDPSAVPTTDPTFNPTNEPTGNPTEGTNMPSVSPETSAPTLCDCVDLIPPGQQKWYSVLERFDCDWYATNPADYCDGGRDSTSFGLTAMQACCVCVDAVTGVRGGSCFTPSNLPTVNPTVGPSTDPTTSPSVSSPSTFPSKKPSPTPTNEPTAEPSLTPSMTPTVEPTTEPTSDPSLAPSISKPTTSPSKSPVTTQPTLSPSRSPTSSNPTSSPSGSPSHAPTERTCAEKVADTQQEIEDCESALSEARSNLTTCESTTVDQETYDELLRNISDCESSVTDLQEELDLLQNGALHACTGNVYVDVYRSEFDFFDGVYFMDSDGDATSYTAINNDAEQVLKHLANGTWILTNGDVRLVTPVVLTGIYPPSLDQWEDPNGLLVIVKMTCYDPQVVDDCDCPVYDFDDYLLEYSGQDCATAAAQFGGSACDHPVYGSYISHFCPATCGKTWADVLVDDDDDVALYGGTSNIDWPFSQCRDVAAYCVDTFVQHPVYRTLCPIATAECENVLDVCDLVCTSRRRRLQDIASTCPYATVTAYHSSYSNYDGTYTLVDSVNLVYESSASTMSYSDGVWSLGSELSTQTGDATTPPAAANWRSDTGSIVVATVECALSIDAMTYVECTTQLDETQQELDECTAANNQLESDISDCWANCADNQQAGAECEAAKALAETRDAFLDVEVVTSSTDIGWEESQYVNRGLDADDAARLRYFDNEIVYDNLDGTFTRTCIAYSTSATDSCDHDDLICPGGSTYGWPGQTYSQLAKAMARPDKVHPECPTGCQLTEWWSDFLTNQGLNPNEICVVDDAFYYIEARQYVFTCIATSDEYTSHCPNNNIVCAGTNSEGYKIYGWPSYQAQLLSTALEQTNHRYRYCPNF